VQIAVTGVKHRGDAEAYFSESSGCAAGLRQARVNGAVHAEI